MLIVFALRKSVVNTAPSLIASALDWGERSDPLLRGQADCESTASMDLRQATAPVASGVRRGPLRSLPAPLSVTIGEVCYNEKY